MTFKFTPTGDGYIEVAVSGHSGTNYEYFKPNEMEEIAEELLELSKSMK